jgi:ornithine cyclodeaminase/alanine dehydrogenase-like protein (mu-crystallin family)
MVRILRDDELRDRLDLARVVSSVEEGYRADARTEVVTLPRTRTDARGTTLAWLGAAIPTLDLLGFRSYLYRSDGADLGHQVVALYGHSGMELRALFLGRLVGNLRTGAAIAAALHLVDPTQRNFGMIGTGYQGRNALACLAAVFPSLHVLAWSPNPERRSAFRDWGRSALGVDVDLADGVTDLVGRCSTVVLVTSADSPVLTARMLGEPRILLSINAYRWPEIEPSILDGVSIVGTDSVEQASGPGTLFEESARKAKLRPLVRALEDGSMRDVRTHRIIINTGAAWQEIVTAQLLLDVARAESLGTEVELGEASIPSPIF